MKPEAYSRRVRGGSAPPMLLSFSFISQLDLRLSGPTRSRPTYTHPPSCVPCLTTPPRSAEPPATSTSFDGPTRALPMTTSTPSRRMSLAAPSAISLPCLSRCISLLMRDAAGAYQLPPSRSPLGAIYPCQYHRRYHLAPGCPTLPLTLPTCKHTADTSWCWTRCRRHATSSTCARLWPSPAGTDRCCARGSSSRQSCGCTGRPRRCCGSQEPRSSEIKSGESCRSVATGLRVQALEVRHRYRYI